MNPVLTGFISFFWQSENLTFKANNYIILFDNEYQFLFKNLVFKKSC